MPSPEPLTPFAVALLERRSVALQEFASAWIDRDISVRLKGQGLPSPDALGAHLRRSFLGALGAGASDAARKDRPCDWDPPCALDVFHREQFRRGSSGLPKPYVLWAERFERDVIVTLRVFGMANDWSAIAGDALIRGIREILPWRKLSSRNVVVVDRKDDWFQPSILPAELGMQVAFVSPFDVTESAAVPANLLVRGLHRVNEVGTWCGVRLTPDAKRGLEDAFHAARPEWIAARVGVNHSANRSGQKRIDETGQGVLQLRAVSAEAALALSLLERTGIGKKTNEGRGKLRICRN